MNPERTENSISTEPIEMNTARLYIMHAAYNRGASPYDAHFEKNQRLIVWSDWLRRLHALSLDRVDLRKTTFERQSRFFGREDLFARTEVLLEFGADPEMRIVGTHGSNLGRLRYNMRAIEVFGSIFRPEQVAMLKDRISESSKSWRPRIARASGTMNDGQECQKTIDWDFLSTLDLAFEI